MQSEALRYIANDGPAAVGKYAEVMREAFLVYFITDHLLEDSRVADVLSFLNMTEERRYARPFAQRNFFRRVEEATDQRILSVFAWACDAPSQIRDAALCQLLDIQKMQEEVRGKKRTRAVRQCMKLDGLASVVATIFKRDEEFLRAHSMDFDAACKTNIRIYERILRYVNRRSAIAYQRETDLLETRTALYNDAWGLKDRNTVTEMVNEEAMSIRAYREETHELVLILDDLTMRHQRLNGIAWQGITWLLQDFSFSPLYWFSGITSDESQTTLR